MSSRANLLLSHALAPVPRRRHTGPRKPRSNKGVKRGPRKIVKTEIIVNNGGHVHVHAAPVRKVHYGPRKPRSNKGKKRSVTYGGRGNMGLARLFGNMVPVRRR
jgi:hypothetical protein